jgi:5'-nucleotidase
MFKLTKEFPVKRAILSTCAVLLASAVGCATKTEKPSAINDINPPAPPVAYQPVAPAQPAAAMTTAAPVQNASLEETTPAPAPALSEGKTTHAKSGVAKTSSAKISGHKYVVQKGDNLYKIAKKAYGDGNDYKKILKANPGMDADKLQAGKTIIIP